VTTGVVEGLLLFLLIIVGATASKPVIRRLRLQYLPRTALTLWFVTLCVLGALFVSPLLNLKTIMNISIFPILILILLVENFLDIQAGMSLKEAINMTMETLVIALICSLILNLDILHKFALLYPEITVVSVAALNIFMGKYVGLRLLEYRKFKELIK
jgi:CDP-diglyceride synthetase